jgi:hypothetical protein
MCILAAKHKPDKDYLSDRLSEASPDRGVGGLHKEGEELWNLWQPLHEQPL